MASFAIRLRGEKTHTHTHRKRERHTREITQGERDTHT